MAIGISFFGLSLLLFLLILTLFLFSSCFFVLFHSRVFGKTHYYENQQYRPKWEKQNCFSEKKQKNKNCFSAGMKNTAQGSIQRLTAPLNASRVLVANTVYGRSFDHSTFEPGPAGNILEIGTFYSATHWYFKLQWMSCRTLVDICFFIVFHSCCSMGKVFGKTLVHEFPISYSHTEWHLLFPTVQLRVHNENPARFGRNTYVLVNPSTKRNSYSHTEWYLLFSRNEIIY